ncbi:hypothetical protein HGM15179_013963 [Zosterops borbonicus]|uniref:Uncharacterized protein n=1 Tax=Zosterops borbonicus TaxID=364589 RepID=A0A8K1LGI2_9PASS|nr:hypothetical protein HGM15179_013963 [Zosterops borbonicus]
MSPQPSEGTMSPQPIEGEMSPQPHEGDMSPQPSEGEMSPQPNEGTISPQPREGDTSPQPCEGEMSPQPGKLKENFWSLSYKKTLVLTLRIHSSTRGGKNGRAEQRLECTIWYHLLLVNVEFSEADILNCYTQDCQESLR